jgi:hypothetical protein
MKAPSTIRRHIRELREMIDTSADPCEQRIAYAMETALRWAALDTTGWPTMRTEAATLAVLLRRELNGSENPARNEGERR